MCEIFGQQYRVNVVSHGRTRGKKKKKSKFSYRHHYTYIGIVLNYIIKRSCKM